MVSVMVFNATFNNISVISWRSLLLVKETAGSGENDRPVTRHWQTLSHNVVQTLLTQWYTDLDNKLKYKPQGFRSHTLWGLNL
jgi:hypothetical protein